MNTPTPRLSAAGLSLLLVSGGLGFAACGGSTGPCGTCTGVTACDPASHSCIPALSPGMPCALPDGGRVSTPCQQGSVCATLSSTSSACAVTCNLNGGGPACPGSEVCGAVSGPDGGRQGLCVSTAGVGQTCSPSALVDCLPPAACIQPPESKTGTCLTVCDPTLGASGCSKPLSCLAIFDVADAGVCASPVSDGAPCNLYTDAFCPQSSLCIEAAGADAGACFQRCEPAEATCGAPTSCLSPLGPTGYSFCATPQANGAPCGTPSGLFCSNSDLCITGTVGSQTGMCEQSCSNGQPCPQGETCNETTNPQDKYCL